MRRLQIASAACTLLTNVFYDTFHTQCVTNPMLCLCKSGADQNKEFGNTQAEGIRRHSIRGNPGAAKSKEFGSIEAEGIRRHPSGTQQRAASSTSILRKPCILHGFLCICLRKPCILHGFLSITFRHLRKGQKARNTEAKL